MKMLTATMLIPSTQNWNAMNVMSSRLVFSKLFRYDQNWVALGNLTTYISTG